MALSEDKSGLRSFSESFDIGVLASAIAVLRLFSGDDPEMEAAIATVNRKHFELLNKQKL